MKHPVIFRSVPGLLAGLLLLSCGNVPGSGGGGASAPAEEPAAEPPTGGLWPAERARELLARTQTVVLAPDLSALTPGERACVKHLTQAGEVLQDLYEQSLHPGVARARAQLDALGDSDRAADLRALYRLFQGPMARLEGEAEPFLGVEPPPPGGGVYPPDMEREELVRFMDAHPETREVLLHPRTVVRRASATSVDADLATLARHEGLATHHGELRSRLRDLRRHPDPEQFYAVPYAVAHADELSVARDALIRAAAAVERDDAAFARYLRLRARAFLTNDYTESDGAWITGRFEHLNAQIGAYEVYDDDLFGVKAFYGFSVLVRDDAASDHVSAAVSELPALHAALPWSPPRELQTRIPLDVYDVVVDFGQARGTNTASILPNEPEVVGRYGRRIMVRRNILQDERIGKNRTAIWQAAMAAANDGDLGPDGEFQRTVWHEIGHYLGVGVDRKGRSLDLALGAHSSVLEEMKADLVSLHLASVLGERSHHPPALVRQIQAAGVRRTLRLGRPHRTEAYATMQLMQHNFFLEKGLLTLNEAGELEVHYERYADVVADLLEQVLRLQHAGDPDGAAAFIERYTAWSDAHEDLARRMREARTFDRILVRYGALGEG